MEDMTPNSVRRSGTTPNSVGGPGQPLTNSSMFIPGDVNFMPSASRLSVPGDMTMQMSSAPFDESMGCLQYSIRQFYNDVDEPWNPVSRSSGLPDTLRGRQNAVTFPLAAALPQDFAQYCDAATASNCGVMINAQTSDSGYGSIALQSEGLGSVESDIDGSGETQSLLGAAFSGFYPNSDTVSIGTLEAASPSKATPRRSKTLSGRSTDGHVCRVCNAKVKTLSEFKKHEARHSKPHMCEIAGCKRKDGFSTHNDLVRHKQTVHNMDGVKYRCTLGQCVHGDKRWPRADNFRSHLYRVHRKSTCSNDDLQVFIDRGQGQDLLGLGQFPAQAGPLPLPEHGLDGAYPSNAWISGLSTLDSDMVGGTMSLLMPSSVISHEQSGSLAGGGSAQPAEMMAQLDGHENELKHSEKKVPHQLDQSTPAQTTSSLVPCGSAAIVHSEAHGAVRDLFSERPGFDEQPGTEKGQSVQLPDHVLPDTTDGPDNIDPRLMGKPLQAPMRAEEASLECMAGNDSDCSNPPRMVVHPRDHLDHLDYVVDTDIPEPEPNVWAEDEAFARLDDTSRGASPEVTAAGVDMDDEEHAGFLEKLKSMEREGSLGVFLKALGYRKTEEVTLDRGSTEHGVPRLPPRVYKRGSGKKVSCPKCSQWYSRPSDLKKHMKRHSKPYPCTHYPTCKKRFGSKNDWKRHENSQHFLRCCEDPRGKNCHSRDRLRNQNQGSGASDGTPAEPGSQPEADDRHHLDGCVVPRYWCGFCCTHIEARRSGDGEKDVCVWHERFDHVERHVLGREGTSGRQIRDWVHYDPKVHDVDGASGPGPGPGPGPGSGSGSGSGRRSGPDDRTKRWLDGNGSGRTRDAKRQRRGVDSLADSEA